MLTLISVTCWIDVLRLWIVSVVEVPARDPSGHRHGQPGSSHARKAWLGRPPGALIQPGAILGPNGAHWPHPPSQHRLSEDQVGVTSRLVDLGILKLTAERHGADWLRANGDKSGTDLVLTQSKQCWLTGPQPPAAHCRHGDATRCSLSGRWCICGSPEDPHGLHERIQTGRHRPPHRRLVRAPVGQEQEPCLPSWHVLACTVSKRCPETWGPSMLAHRVNQWH